MPIPSKKEGEDRSSFMSRCMSDQVMQKEYTDKSQRAAICVSKACEDLDMVAQADFQLYVKEYGYEEELTEENFYIPAEAEYEDFGEEVEEIEVASLWENIRKKKEREGKNYKPAKKGDKDRPDPEAWKKAKSAEYQGRKVKLGKPFLTPDGPKKRSVYVKNDKGNVVKVNFGDPNMEIKKDNPARRKSFRARHNCDNPGPRWKARYWSCRAW
tara:strand:+ start:878 stop:1516 length:639 start_codon:yes stop_codon:yes gene_type:complete